MIHLLQLCFLFLYALSLLAVSYDKVASYLLYIEYSVSQKNPQTPINKCFS